MQPVQSDRCTLHILDDSSVVRADGKGHVVDPAELGDQPVTHLIQHILTEHLFAWLWSLWGERLKQQQQMHFAPSRTLLQRRVLQGMGRNLDQDAARVVADWDGHCEGKRTLSNDSIEQKTWNQAAVSKGIPSDAESREV